MELPHASGIMSFLLSLFGKNKRLIKDRGAIVLTASQPFTSALVMSNTQMFKYCWIWEKPQGTDPFMSGIRPMNNYEDICIFSLGTTFYNPQKASGDPYKVVRDRRKPRVLETTDTAMRMTKTINHGNRCPTRILNFDQERGYHPTQKPVALFEYLIKTYTNEGDLVLDNCIGSGTTAVAAKRTGRHFIGIELSSEYCEIARKRVAAVPARLDRWAEADA